MCADGLEYNTVARFFIFSRILMVCKNHKCADSHSHAHDDESDPCFQKEVAAAEKARVRYTMLKEQSDKLLSTLNIRTTKLRPRSAVQNTEESEPQDTPDSTEASALETHVCEPSRLGELTKAHPDCTVFVVCHPCDQLTQDTVLSEFEGVISTLSLSSSSSVLFVKFKCPMCVCGKCPSSESRISGPLRSVGMLLRHSSSVVALRKGGLIGMWQGSSSGPLTEFIRKYV